MVRPPRPTTLPRSRCPIRCACHRPRCIVAPPRRCRSLPAAPSRPARAAISVRDSRRARVSPHHSRLASPTPIDASRHASDRTADLASPTGASALAGHEPQPMAHPAGLPSPRRIIDPPAPWPFRCPADSHAARDVRRRMSPIASPVPAPAPFPRADRGAAVVPLAVVQRTSAARPDRRQARARAARPHHRAAAAFASSRSIPRSSRFLDSAVDHPRAAAHQDRSRKVPDLSASRVGDLA